MRKEPRENRQEEKNAKCRTKKIVDKHTAHKDDGYCTAFGVSDVRTSALRSTKSTLGEEVNFSFIRLVAFAS